MLGLEELLADCAVIRTTLETLDLFPNDEDLRAEMWPIITDARSHLLIRLDDFQADRDRQVDTFASRYGTAFQQLFRRASTTGLSRRTLDETMKVGVFESVVAVGGPDAARASKDAWFRYRLESHRSSDELNGHAPQQLVPLLLQDLTDTLRDDGNYRDRETFDRAVFQKYVALLYLFWAATDPLFGNGGE